MDLQLGTGAINGPDQSCHLCATPRPGPQLFNTFFVYGDQGNPTFRCHCRIHGPAQCTASFFNICEAAAKDHDQGKADNRCQSQHENSAQPGHKTQGQAKKIKRCFQA